MSEEDLTQTGVRADGWPASPAPIRRSTPAPAGGTWPTGDTWPAFLPGPDRDSGTSPVTEPHRLSDSPPGAPGWASPPAGARWRRRHRLRFAAGRTGSEPTGNRPIGSGPIGTGFTGSGFTGSDPSGNGPTGIELAGDELGEDELTGDELTGEDEPATDGQPYSRVDLRRLARRRQRRRWLLVGLAVTSVLVLLISYLRPDPATQQAEPVPSVGYALPPLEPGVPYEPPVRVPGLNPVLSPPASPSGPPVRPPAAPDAETGPMITVTQAGVPSIVDLSTVGPVDWVHWGTDDRGSLDRKRGGSRKIADQGGRGGRGRYDNNPQRFSWRDGERDRVEPGTTTGVYSCGRDSGFTLSVAADPEARTLRLYAGVWRARGRLQVRLSSGGPTGTAALENRTTNGTAEFTIRFRAPAGAHLELTWTAEEVYYRHCGNVSLQAAALS